MDTTTFERTSAAPTRALTPETELKAAISHIAALESTLAEFSEPQIKAELHRELSLAHGRRAEVEARLAVHRAAQEAEEARRAEAEAEAAAAAAEEVEHDEEVEADLNPEEITEEEVAEADAGHPEVLEEEAPEADEPGPVSLEDTGELSSEEEAALVAAARAVADDEEQGLSDEEILKRALNGDA